MKRGKLIGFQVGTAGIKEVFGVLWLLFFKDR